MEIRARVPSAVPPAVTQPRRGLGTGVSFGKHTPSQAAEVPLGEGTCCSSRMPLLAAAE